MKKPTQRKRVEKYLNRLMKGRYFTIDDLLSLTVSDLKSNTPILDISRSTVSKVLADYKKKFAPKKNQDDSADSKAGKPESDNTAPLSPAENARIRALLSWFESRQSDDITVLDELKVALQAAGIDYLRVLSRFRERQKT